MILSKLEFSGRTLLNLYTLQFYENPPSGLGVVSMRKDRKTNRST